MKRDPLAIIHHLAHALSKLETGTRLSHHQLAKRAGVSWETAEKYSRIIALIQGSLPRIDLTAGGEIVITQNPILMERDTPEGVLQRLFYAKAFTRDGAVRIEAPSTLDALETRKLVIREDSNVWLSVAGIPEAFAITDARDSAMHRSFAEVGRLEGAPQLEESREGQGGVMSVTFWSALPSSQFPNLRIRGPLPPG